MCYNCLNKNRPLFYGAYQVGSMSYACDFAHCIYFIFTFSVLLLDFTHIFQGNFAGTGATIRLTQCQWSNLEGYGKMDHMNPLLTHWNRDKMDAIFQTTFSNAFSWMKMYKFRLRFHWILFPKVPIKNIPSLVRIMAWRRSGEKPLSEPMMISLLTNIFVTRPLWVHYKSIKQNKANHTRVHI